MSLAQWIWVAGIIGVNVGIYLSGSLWSVLPYISGLLMGYVADKGALPAGWLK